MAFVVELALPHWLAGDGDTGCSDNNDGDVEDKQDEDGDCYLLIFKYILESAHPGLPN